MTLAIFLRPSIFQFTPLREGRRKCALPYKQGIDFNSRPSARGDKSAHPRTLAVLLFQFTPLREGRPIVVTAGITPGAISIHAPPRGATCKQVRVIINNVYFNSRPSARGDELHFDKSEYDVLFQFTPLREGRPVLWGTKNRTGRFQFTPLREGRHGYACRVVRGMTIFQFTPLREGRHVGFACWRDNRDISIHAPPRGATPAGSRLNRRPDYFNSRPSARGDLRRQLRAAGFQVISIHAPPRGATAARRCSGSIAHYFNSRPSARGDSKRYAISANLLFNPYKSAWLNNNATQFVEIILVIFHRIIA